jgi:hypothetical protein
LGVLASVDGDYRYTAYVLDPRLHRAVAARRYCIASDLHSAMASVLASGREAVVSWSEFDRNVVTAAKLPPEVEKPFRARWVNALTTVRRWKSRLYRQWELPTVADADGHALKVYMKAIGYQVPAALGPGRAAYWLAQVLNAMEAAGGNYRRISPRMKRHWHSLLEYNRHDCEGMRAAYERACRELTLETAYRATTYTARLDESDLPVRIGQFHRALDARLRDRGAAQWACITAYNPQSVALTRQENERRDAELRRRLDDTGVRHYPARAEGDDGRWPAELGVLAAGISRGRAEALGRAFDQAAVVLGRAGRLAELVWCNRLLHATRRRDT